MFWKKHGEENTGEKPLETALLREAVDDVQLSFIKDVLEESGIHILTRDRENGDYMRILAGTSIFGRDVYVEKSLLPRAQEILAQYESNGMEEETAEE